MSLRLRVILLVLLLIGMTVIVNMVRQRVLELKYVLAWMFADVILILFVLVPGLIKGLSSVLGIYSPMNMIFFLGFLLSLVIIFTLTVALSKVTASVRRMSQTIALLEKRLQEQSEQDSVETRTSQKL
ncbi:MAG: DUF2304 domain-containing protein [Sarcina sp.]|nr:DUF2304 domain-containing protein [Sarcina sp.]